MTVPSIEDESAGPSYTVPALGSALQGAGVAVELHTLRKVPERKWTYPVRAYWRSRLPLLRYLCWSPDMFRGFRAAAKTSDIIHVNGVWQLADVYPSRAVRGTKCKVVYCPRGGLSRAALWRGKTFVKRLMWHFGGQRRALREAAMFHAASQKEAEEIRALGFTQPIAVVPNGIDLPNVVHRPFAAANRRLVFFGRLHPTKAADHLVAAWGRVAAEFPEWSVEIAGPDCGVRPQLEAMIEERKIPRIRFVGELKGPTKYEFLANADLYVLPSLTENFGITIAEALACGTPVVASKGCPWPGVLGEGEGKRRREEAKDEGEGEGRGEKAKGEGRCGWWIGVGAEALERCLREALKTSPEELEAMGRIGRAWMERDFTWAGVGRKMRDAYRWLIQGGEKPEEVYVLRQ